MSAMVGCRSGGATRRLACAVIAGLLLISGQARAYRTGADLPQLASTPKVRWESATIEYELNDIGAPGVSFADVQTAAWDAARSWASISCGGPDFRYRGATSDHAIPADGRNTVEWVSDWSARGFLADAAGQTDVQYEQNDAGEWRIVEADIYLNAEDHAWSSGTSADDSTRDVATVLTHELGHVLGLMHPCELTAQGTAPRCTESFGRPTMHPVYGADQLSLEADDEAGACFLYPSANCSDDSCGLDHVCTRDGCVDSCGGKVCASGETCSFGLCVPSRVCAEGTCPQTCNVTADCDPNLACIDGVCNMGSGQRGDVCQGGQECRSGSCVENFCANSCTTSDSCAEGESCEEDHSVNVCVSSRKRMGESCSESDDCIGNECLVGADLGPVCSRLCSTDQPCPGNWECSTVAGRAVCTPPWFAASGGCGLVKLKQSRPSLVWLMCIGLCVGFVARRRRRSSSIDF